jgi:hypothetical protein
MFFICSKVSSQNRQMKTNTTKSIIFTIVLVALIGLLTGYTVGVMDGVTRAQDDHEIDSANKRFYDDTTSIRLQTNERLHN